MPESAGVFWSYLRGRYVMGWAGGQAFPTKRCLVGPERQTPFEVSPLSTVVEDVAVIAKQQQHTKKHKNQADRKHEGD